MELLDFGFDIKKTRFYQDVAEENQAIGEAIGEARGEARGETKGVYKGLFKLLTDRFGQLSEAVLERLQNADEVTLLGYYEKIWHIEKPEDLFSDISDTGNTLR